MLLSGSTVFHSEMHHYKMAWYSILPLVPTHDFGMCQAVKFGGSKTGPEVITAIWDDSGCHG